MQQRHCSLFSFSHVDKEEILSLDSTKVSQDADIPTKIIKDNRDIFSDFLLSGFNNSIITSFIFSSTLKQAILTAVFKKGEKIRRKTIDQLPYYQIYRRYLSDFSLNKFLTS